MRFKKVKQMLVLMALSTSLCSTAVYAAEPVAISTESSEETTDESISDEETVIDHTEVSDGEQTLPDKDQLSQTDESKTGSISIQLTDGKHGTSKAGVKFFCIKVADVVHGEYKLTDTYENSGVDLNTIENSNSLKDAAAKLAKVTKDKNIFTSTNENGFAVFDDLEVGVYLVIAEDNANYDTIDPSMIAIPTWSEEDVDMLYDVAMEPKHTPKPDIPSNRAPQTNLQDKTVYYLAGAGLCICAAGVVFALGKKKGKSK